MATPRTAIDKASLEIWADTLEAAIDRDTKIELDARANIKKNRALLNSIRAYIIDGPPTCDRVRIAPTNIDRAVATRGGRKKGGRKLDLVVSAIRSLPNKTFVAGDVLAQLQKSFPERPITRKQLSSLMWKLSTTKEGKETFRQTVPWPGGNAEARYEVIHLKPENVRGTQWDGQGSYRLQTAVREKKM